MLRNEFKLTLTKQVFETETTQTNDTDAVTLLRVLKLIKKITCSMINSVVESVWRLGNKKGDRASWLGVRRQAFFFKYFIRHVLRLFSINILMEIVILKGFF